MGAFSSLVGVRLSVVPGLCAASQHLAELQRLVWAVQLVAHLRCSVVLLGSEYEVAFVWLIFSVISRRFAGIWR